jgi:hypothetical protein
VIFLIGGWVCGLRVRVKSSLLFSLRPWSMIAFTHLKNEIVSVVPGGETSLSSLKKRTVHEVNNQLQLKNGINLKLVINLKG